MIDQQDCITTIAKSGRNLLAYIPSRFHNLIGRGDKVKIVLLEKAPNLRDLNQGLDEFLKNPNSEKLKGTVMGFHVEIPISKLISYMPKSKAKKLFHTALKNE